MQVSAEEGGVGGPTPNGKSLFFHFLGPFPNSSKIQNERSIFIWRKKRQGRLPWFHAHWLSWMLPWFLPKIIYRLFDNKFQHFVYLRVNTCYFHTAKILHFKKQIILLGYHWHLFLKSWFCKRFAFKCKHFIFEEMFEDVWRICGLHFPCDSSWVAEQM